MNQPPKLEEGGDYLASLTLDEAIARSNAILDKAIADIQGAGKELTGIVALFSGGNDSTVLAHLMRERMTHACHINTGIGIPDTRQYVKDTCERYGIPLIIKHPEGHNRYEALVAEPYTDKKGVTHPARGFPGPAGHRLMYTRLKERQLESLRRDFIPRGQGHKRRVIFLGGMRVFESSRRWRNSNEIDRVGAAVFVSPIVHWTDAHMKEYRKRHECQELHRHLPNKFCGDLGRNEVSDKIHMSGECLCGSFAKPNELDEIRFWFPEVAAHIDALQEKVAAQGVKACKWGVRPPKAGATPAGRLCTSCVIGETGEDTGPTVEEMLNDYTITRAA